MAKKVKLSSRVSFSKREDGEKEALHVQVEPLLMERYRKLTKQLGISMRSLVMIALDDVYRKYSPEVNASTVLAAYSAPPERAEAIVTPAAAPTTASSEAFQSMFGTTQTQLSLQQAQRLNQLEMRVEILEVNTRGMLRERERRGKWRHTHNASVRGTITNLYMERHGEFALFFEREATNPTWMITPDGRLGRLDGEEAGIVVAVA